MAVNQAIAAAAAGGGGTVYFPAGTYRCGSIHLLSHIHLLLDAGATILGASSDTYDPAEPFPIPLTRTGATPIFTTALSGEKT